VHGAFTRTVCDAGVGEMGDSDLTAFEHQGLLAFQTGVLMFFAFWGGAGVNDLIVLVEGITDFGLKDHHCIEP
jgi:hypothetical protein